MDPTATYRMMTDDSLPLDERAEAALSLLAWLAKGGLFPQKPANISLADFQNYVIEQCQATLTKVIEIMPGGTARMLGL